MSGRYTTKILVAVDTHDAMKTSSRVATVVSLHITSGFPLFWDKWFESGFFLLQMCSYEIAHMLNIVWFEQLLNFSMCLEAVTQFLHLLQAAVRARRARHLQVGQICYHHEYQFEIGSKYAHLEAPSWRRDARTHDRASPAKVLVPKLSFNASTMDVDF